MAPATPVLMTMRTSYFSSSSAVIILAFTLPMPLSTRATSRPASRPRYTFVWAMLSVVLISIHSFRISTSGFIAPMIPMTVLSVNGNNLDFHIIAIRERNADLVFKVSTKQCICYWCLVGDFPFERVRFRTSDNLVLLFVSVGKFSECHSVPELDFVFVVTLFNDLGMTDHVLDLCDFLLDETLFIFGGIVFGVLGKVAETSCHFYLFHHFRTLDRLKLLKLLLQLFITTLCHRKFFLHIHHNSSIKFFVLMNSN